MDLPINSMVIFHSYVNVYQRVWSLIRVNYNDLTATSLESWLIREIIPKWPYFRFVKYSNLPIMPGSFFTSPGFFRDRTLLIQSRLCRGRRMTSMVLTLARPLRLEADPSWEESQHFCHLVPSGKHTKNYGKSPFFMGKSTINGDFP